MNEGHYIANNAVYVVFICVIVYVDVYTACRYNILVPCFLVEISRREESRRTVPPGLLYLCRLWLW